MKSNLSILGSEQGKHTVKCNSETVRLGVIEVSIKDGESTTNPGEGMAKTRNPGTEWCVYVWRNPKGGNYKHAGLAGAATMTQGAGEAARGKRRRKLTRVLLFQAKGLDSLRVSEWTMRNCN